MDGLLADSPLYPACRDGYARVDDLKVTDRNICVWVRDGRTLTVPLGWFLRLADGSPAKRDRWEEPGDSMLGWPDLDEYLTVAGSARLIRQAVRAQYGVLFSEWSGGLRFC